MIAQLIAATTPRSKPKREKWTELTKHLVGLISWCKYHQTQVHNFWTIFLLPCTIEFEPRSPQKQKCLYMTHWLFCFVLCRSPEMANELMRTAVQQVTSTVLFRTVRCLYACRRPYSLPGTSWFKTAWLNLIICIRTKCIVKLLTIVLRVISVFLF